MIGAAIVAEGRKYGLNAIRVPAQPNGGMMAWWARRLSAGWRRAGLACNDQVAGLAQTGAFDTEAMLAAIASLPEGFTEIYTHPATADAYNGSAPGYRYRAELAALTNPQVKAALAATGADFGPFARFLPSPDLSEAA